MHKIYIVSLFERVRCILIWLHPFVGHLNNYCEIKSNFAKTPLYRPRYSNFRSI